MKPLLMGFAGLLLALAASACTTITEVREVDCEWITAYDDNEVTLDMSKADSLVFTGCDPKEWEGIVVRFAP